MTRKLDNVVALYVAGVGDGHVLPAVDKYLAPGCVDNTSVRTTDARRVFLSHYEPLVHRFPDRFVRPLRAFEDGSRVFLHSYQSFGRGQTSQVCVDVFDTDADDQITARWNVTAPLVSPSRSGRSQIDGPTQVTDFVDTDQNRSLVRRFNHDVLVHGGWERLERYLDPGGYAEHSPEIPDGVPGFRDHHDRQASAGRPVRYQEPSVLVGRGNYVVTLCRATRGSEPYHVFDIYRLEAGRIVEHWDAAATAR